MAIDLKGLLRALPELVWLAVVVLLSATGWWYFGLFIGLIGLMFLPRR